MTDQILNPSRLPLSARQMLVLVGYGAIAWFAAALLIRFLGPLGVFDGATRLLTYALVIPGTVPLVLGARWLAGLRRDQIGLGMAVSTTTATLLDGVALAWFPALYGDTVALVAAAGAVILWGAGVGMAIGFAMNATGTK
ncbi:MAG: hypothetical protein ACOYLS_06185 [Polymorphobacter sp.]